MLLTFLPPRKSHGEFKILTQFAVTTSTSEEKINIKTVFILFLSPSRQCSEHPRTQDPHKIFFFYIKSEGLTSTGSWSPTTSNSCIWPYITQWKYIWWYTVVVLYVELQEPVPTSYQLNPHQTRNQKPITYILIHTTMITILLSVRAGRYCGRGTLPVALESSDSRMWIEYRYRGSPGYRGFSAEYEGTWSPSQQFDSTWWVSRWPKNEA